MTTYNKKNTSMKQSDKQQQINKTNNKQTNKQTNKHIYNKDKIQKLKQS